ncbi:MAG: hypothetical protein K9K75_02185 [Deltaproteobacteria bacterium]|nr:hypothetical protein [Deltaproteobacteria bacterium]
MIPTYCPEANGRVECAFRTHQDRISKKLALLGITTTEAANNYLLQSYMLVFNAFLFNLRPLGGSKHRRCFIKAI